MLIILIQWKQKRVSMISAYRRLNHFILVHYQSKMFFPPWNAKYTLEIRATRYFNVINLLVHQICIMEACVRSVISFILHHYHVCNFSRTFYYTLVKCYSCISPRMPRYLMNLPSVMIRFRVTLGISYLEMQLKIRCLTPSRKRVATALLVRFIALMSSG